MKKFACLLFVLLLNAFTVAKVHGVEEVLTVGDSITAGLKLNAARTLWICPPDGVVTTSFYTCNGDGVKNLGGYQPATKTALANTGVNANLYNWGFAGQTSVEIIGGLIQAISSRSADYVMLMAGTNDVGAGFSSGTIIFNLTVMLDLICSEGLKPILGTITPRFDGNFNGRILSINNGIRDYAESIFVPVAENYTALIGNWNAYHSGDNLHLGSAGDAVLATQWTNAFEEAEYSCTGRATIIAPQIMLLLE